MEIEKEIFKQFAVVELMGHSKCVAIISEPEFGGSQLLKLQVLGVNGEINRTEYIGIGSIYRLTIVTEETAKAAASRNAPEPVWAWSLPQPQLNAGESAIEADFDDDLEESRW